MGLFAGPYKSKQKTFISLFESSLNNNSPAMFVHIKRLLREGALNPTIVNTYEESYPPFPLPSITLDPILHMF